ncbi:hypothetical protein ACLOAV_008331 [Pseudogymnoascus australis]
MALGTMKPVPGLETALQTEDLKESCRIYNTLRDASKQQDILDQHIHNLAALFVKHGAEGILGIHLVHSHFSLPENTAMLGANYETPYSRWTRPIPIHTVDLSNVHGHIFVFSDHGFHPYEYQYGPRPDLSRVNSNFLADLAGYLKENKLSNLIGLQVIDQTQASMIELVLPHATIMLKVSDVRGCKSSRQTGWMFKTENGEPQVCQATETHGETGNGHVTYNKGKPHPKLNTFEDVKIALEKEGVLYGIHVKAVYIPIASLLSIMPQIPIVRC